MPTGGQTEEGIFLLTGSAALPYPHRNYPIKVRIKSKLMGITSAIASLVYMCTAKRNVELRKQNTKPTTIKAKVKGEASSILINDRILIIKRGNNE